jgi:hypothetical protein
LKACESACQSVTTSLAGGMRRARSYVDKARIFKRFFGSRH